MFKDELFYRARKYVSNEITLEEAELYLSKRIRKIYSSFEELLLDNIIYYNRIIRSVLVFYENRIYEYGSFVGSFEKTKYTKNMTPTRLYHLILVQGDFGRDEILLGHPQLKTVPGDTFRELLPHLINIGSFNFIASYTSAKYKSRSYMKCLELDVTSNQYINKVLDIKTICYIDKKSIEDEFERVLLISNNMDMIRDVVPETKNSLLSISPLSISSMSQYYSWSLLKKDEKMIRTQVGDVRLMKKIDLSVSRNIEVIDDLFSQNTSLLKDLQSLYAICGSMIQFLKVDFVGYKRFGSGSYMKLKAKRFWNNYRIIEHVLDSNGNILHHQSRTFGKLSKAVDYIISTGYFVYGDESDKKSNVMNIAMTESYDQLFEVYEKYGSTTLATATAILSLISLENDRILKHMKSSYNLYQEYNNTNT